MMFTMDTRAQPEPSAGPAREAAPELLAMTEDLRFTLPPSDRHALRLKPQNQREDCSQAEPTCAYTTDDRPGRVSASCQRLRLTM
jgi:hypothetical protein